MENKTPLYLLGEVARRLGCPPHRIVYLFSSGKATEPALRLGNRRVFTEQDIVRIAALITFNQENEQ